MNKPFFLYIINSAGISLFSYNFKRKLEVFDVCLFSGFITAISKFSEELNKQLSSTDNPERIPSIPINKTFEIMISYKKDLIGALIVERKDIDEDMKNFLDDLLNEFLLKYKDILSNWNDDIVYFEDFQDEIERIFRKVQLFSFQIPKLKNGLDNKFREKGDYNNLLHLIDGQKDINTISELLSKSKNEIKYMISNLLWNEIITISEKVYDYDIFEPKRDLFYLIRSRNVNPEKKILNENLKSLEEFDLLKAIDGFKTVYDLSLEFPNFTLHDIKYTISYFLTQGNYLERVELYPQIITISEETRDLLPEEYLALSYSLENICDGDISLSEISQKMDFPIKEIKNVLNKIKNHVTYRKKCIK
ncbi:MAG: hypothetical protein ACTSO9_03025 [Candidatus Helarchaeota archaeon]